MNLDRIDPFSAGQVSGGQNRPVPQHPASAPPFTGSSGKQTPAPDSFLADLSVPTAGAVSHSFAKDWAKSSAAYGTHSLAAEAINRATAPNTPLMKKLNANKQVATDKLRPASQVGSAMNAAQKSLTYSDIFHLGTKQMPIHKFDTTRLQNTVKANLGEFKQAVKPANIGHFFQETTAKDYFKQTVLQENLKPAKDLLTNNPDKKIGTGLFRTAAMGFMGLDVYKHTKAAYKHAKAQEDGSIKSQWRTAAATGEAFTKYTLRDGTSWEAAGVGAAIGKALIPIALGGISLGGVLVGALAGLAVEKMLDKLLKTGKHDPIASHKEHAFEGKEGSSISEDVRTGAARR